MGEREGDEGETAYEEREVDATLELATGSPEENCILDLHTINT